MKMPRRLSAWVSSRSRCSAAGTHFWLAILSLSVWQDALPAAEPPRAFEGSVAASWTRHGAPPTEILFTRKGHQLRVENVDKSKPEPVNVIDLDAKKLTIIYPHNSSFMRIDLTKAPTAPGALPPGMPNPAAGIPSPPPGAQPAITPPPGFPTRPPMPVNPVGAGMPGMPPIPVIPGGARIPGGMPMPAMPAFPRPGGGMVLKKTEETRTIHGFKCTRYTLGDRHETFEIWATPDSSLFPFRLLQRNPNTRRFGPPMLDEEWLGLLQMESLFPLEATLRDEAGNERLSFKVTKVDATKVDDAGGKLFAPPERYFESVPPPF